MAVCCIKSIDAAKHQYVYVMSIHQHQHLKFVVRYCDYFCCIGLAQQLPVCMQYSTASIHLDYEEQRACLTSHTYANILKY